MSRLLLSRAKDEYLNRANEIKKTEIKDMKKLNQLYRIRNLKQLLTEKIKNQSRITSGQKSPSRATTVMTGNASMHKARMTFGEEPKLVNLKQSNSNSKSNSPLR